jgi:hypothetical protein
MDKVYARLDAGAFQALVEGRAVDLPGTLASGQTATVRLILADIGWGNMMKAIGAAMQAEAEPPEPCIIPPGEPLR